MKSAATIFLAFASFFMFFQIATQEVLAQISPSDATLLNEVASPSATASATLSATTAPSPNVQQLIQERQESDLTQVTGRQKDELVAFLEENPPEPLNWSNALQHGIRNAINQGLPANIVVILILFPIIASIIAASRHLIGLHGFGIYIPAVLSVAFVSTGISTGVVIFTVVLLAASLFRMGLKRLQLQYLPRTALLLWGVSLSVLLLLLAVSTFGISWLLSINIFPILIIMLLTENFMETQLTSSHSQAIQLTLETLLLAVICSLIISYQPLQRVVLLRPELVFISVAAFNMVVGRYAGLRLLEYIRFRSLLEQ